MDFKRRDEESRRLYFNSKKNVADGNKTTIYNYI